MNENAVWTIGRAKEEDFEALHRIELAAFRTLLSAGAVTGLPEATGKEGFANYLQQGLLLSAIDAHAQPIGFGAALVMSDTLHICEMDVHPDWQRRGIGRALIQRLLEEGRGLGLAQATLTTDRYAPFNAPFYARQGFQIVRGDEPPYFLTRILAEEAAKGLDPERRVAMARPL
ncbi:GNAT family N-acetyltransferase [Rhizobium helianthi]|uniref:GNAT family N-acetyltransferase n=1 Tax=Rhizobium helianthi TaxID=1132695 RepID=A0ABW4M472_9HYPH